MKYVLLACDNEHRLATMSPSERSIYEAACVTTTERLRASGHLRVVARLQDLHVATTIQVRNGQVDVMIGPPIKTDKPFSELFVVEARDLNEAMRVAAQLPLASTGSIEVRPLTSLEIG